MKRRQKNEGKKMKDLKKAKDSFGSLQIVVGGETAPPTHPNTTKRTKST
jgi:hypothetical protein